MKTFITPDFLLQNKTSQKLYHDYAENLPIIDFHNHLPPSYIASNKKFNTITELWLDGDHYKWRAMRAAGKAEKFCSGNASDWEKFQAWAETVPMTIRNPLYHWSHLELIRYFGISTLLNPETASEIYKSCNEQLQKDENRVVGLLNKMNVEILCTTDDPIDNLEYHIACKDKNPFRMLPAFRPDKILKVENTQAYNLYIDQLASIAAIDIQTYDELLQALKKRHDFFHSIGCRISDHGLDFIPNAEFTESDLKQIFIKVRSKKDLTLEEIQKFQTGLLSDLLRMNWENGWAQQLHIGAIRNNNQRIFTSLGFDKGIDSIGETPIVEPLARLLNILNNEDKLARTIGYNLNPANNESLISMLYNFNDGNTKGKMQYGAAWWFLDQKVGIEKNIQDLSSLGLLQLFIGMVTDSRSFISFPRHEYFRRILCNILGEDVEKGLIPDDKGLLKNLIEAVCYRNAKEFINW